VKILITSDWYKPQVNGVVTSVLNLEKGLRELGHEVKVLTLSRTTHFHVEGDVTYCGAIRADYIYPGASIIKPMTGVDLQPLIAWKPDIIHSQCEFSTFQIALRIAEKTKAPIVHTYHTSYEDYIQYFPFLEYLGHNVIALFSRQILLQTRYVIVPTEKVKLMLQGYNVKQPIEVIPTGLDLERFFATDREEIRMELRSRLSIPADAKVLLYVGRVAQEKHIDRLLDYLAKMDMTSLRFVIVGDGPYKDTLATQAHALGLDSNVIFTGMIRPEEVAAYYTLGDIFVSASTSETQGLTYVEALASGLPALCKKDPCLDGVIIDGTDGYQFDGFDDFSSHLQQLVTDDGLRSQLGDNARQRMKENYGYLQFARHVVDVYSRSLVPAVVPGRILSRVQMIDKLEKVRNRYVVEMKVFYEKAGKFREGLDLSLRRVEWWKSDWWKPKD
jgi:1,2-diacylglycerol 3-alpha-glucosyltransferase